MTAHENIAVREDVDSNLTEDPNRSISTDDPLSDEAKVIANNKWRQLRCKTTTMSYNANWVKCIYIIIAVICLPIGIYTYSLSQTIVVQEFEAYNTHSACSLENKTYGKQCTINYTISYDFTPPIYFHYKLTNFFQNHRSYVKSRSETQLRNEDISDVSTCDPLQTYSGNKLLPCGLIANSFFNDKYIVTYIPITNTSARIQLCPESDAYCGSFGDEQYPNEWSDKVFYSNGSNGNWDISDIAWESDVSERFAETNVDANGMTNRGELQVTQGITLPDTDDKDLIVWMRTATTPTFTKLHRIIHGLEFKKGDVLQIQILNYFRVFGIGTKSIVITENEVLGGKNDAMGIGFICIGSVALLTALLFWIFVPPNRSSTYNA